jgi:hypothetical protein
MVYPGLGQSVPYVQQLMILILKSTQNQGVTTECTGERGRFDRGSLRVDPKVTLPLVEPSPSPERRKTTSMVEELSMPPLWIALLSVPS